MSSPAINLSPLAEFLTDAMSVEDLIGELDKAYYLFSEMILKTSIADNLPVSKTELDALYWIRQIKEVLTETQTA